MPRVATTHTPTRGRRTTALPAATERGNLGLATPLALNGRLCHNAPVQSGIWAFEVVKPLVGAVRSCTAVSESFDYFNRLAAALAKSQDRRASLGVFAFGQPNAVRRWLGLGYPATRASQSRGRGRSPRARWLKESGTVRCDDTAPKSRSSEHRAKPVLVR